MSDPHNLSHITYMKILKNLNFRQMQVKASPGIEICWNRHNFSFILGRKKDGCTSVHQKVRFLLFSVYEMCRKL